MTMREIVSTLSSMGYEVKYTIRNDGGIRITRLNGKAFRGSQGNVEARAILGVQLSEARTKQLEKIKTPKKQWGHKKLDIIPEETKKEIRKMQRQFKKKGTKAGMPTIRKYRANIKLFGKKEADRLLRQASRYGQGLAYEENVDWLLVRLKQIYESYPSEVIKEAMKMIKDKKPIFKEEWIQAINNLAVNGSELGMAIQTGKYTPDELGQMIIDIIK